MIVQHLVPTSQLGKSKPLASASADVKTEGVPATTEKSNSPGEKKHVGRRGMHSATAAYWNESTDGMWSYKYEGGEDKGMDVVISVIWMST